MTLGSLFDGSGTALLAATMCGIAPVWAAEIEPYPIAVTRTHFPDVIHLGDVTRIDGAAIPPVDVIVFGSPCQDVSVAGRREGMKHAGRGDGETTRSGLFFEAVRIIREMRGATNGEYPAFAVWENVPGAFSSNGGGDFRRVLEEFAQTAAGSEVSVPRPANGRWAAAGEIVADGWSLAWRVLDAQYWGVPQRRRRIYLVADFGGRRAGKVLFERDGLRGHPAPGGEAREGAAAGAGGGVARGDRIYAIHDKATRYRGGGAGRHGDGAGNGLGISDDGTMYTLDTGCRHALAFMAGQGAKAGSVAASEEYSPTLRAATSGTNQVPSVVYPQVARTLTAEADASPCIDRGQNIIVTAFDCRGNGNGNVVGTLIGDHQNRATDYSNIICASGETSKGEYVIRRLTPNECCRLQGFPDGWGTPRRINGLTDEEVEFWNGVRKTALRIAGKTARPLPKEGLIRWINGLHSDSAEYKMWGNGMALPCLLYVIEGIALEAI